MSVLFFHPDQVLRVCVESGRDNANISKALSQFSTLSNIMPKYDDYDWKQLPPAAQVAAMALGYTAELWDIDAAAPTSDYDWDELSAEQQGAAAVLGYNQILWDSS